MINKKLFYRSLICIALSAAPVAEAVTYSAFELGSFGVVSITPVSSLNDVGQVVGNFSPNPPPSNITHAFISGPDGVGKTDLGSLLSGGNSFATAINASGHVVGSANTFGGSHAFITGANGVGITDLGVLPNQSDSVATGINAAGQVVGYSLTPGTAAPWQAFITGANGIGMNALGTLGGKDSRAHAINASGQVAGVSQTSSGALHAFITGANGVGMIDIGRLSDKVNDVQVNGINDVGQVIGTSYTLAGVQHAFITGINGAGMIDLGTLGGSVSGALGMNESGQVVGVSTKANDAAAYAFITGANGIGMTDLNTLLTVSLANGAHLVDAWDINNLGQVIATDNFGKAYLLTPTVPLPASVWLMLSSLGGLAAIARKRW